MFRREGGIFERDLTSGAERRVSPTEFTDCSFPSYLSETSILFVNQTSIYKVDPASSAIELLATGQPRGAPRASPDGLLVIWQDNTHLALLELNTGKSTQLTSQGGVQSCPVWSEDGEYVAYCQSPSLESPWDLYVTRASNPDDLWLVRQNVHPNFDWCGLYQPTGPRLTIPERKFNVRSPETGERSIENSWLEVSLSSQQNRAEVFFKKSPAGDPVLEISPLTADPSRLGNRPPIQLQQEDQGKIRLDMLPGQTGPTTNLIGLSLYRHRPILEIHGSGLQAFSLKTQARYALIPDRLASGLLLEPTSSNSGSLTLPYTPFLLLSLKDRSGIVMIVTPSDNQQLELRSEKGAFEEMVISPGLEKVFVFLLNGEEFWNNVSVQKTEEGTWQAGWDHPFLAQWRFVVLEQGRSYSQMWGEESLAAKTSSFLPIQNSFASPPEKALVYLFARSRHTPLGVLTPAELVLDALGVERGRRLLDEEGIRSYRTASRPVSIRSITTRKEDWSRELVHVDSRDPNWVELGILETLQGLRAADTPGVRSMITHFGQDIVSILEGLDQRMGEYEGFLLRLTQFCQMHKARAGRTSDFLTGVEEQARELQTKVSQMRVSPSSRVSETIDKILDSLGTGTYLHSTREYSELSKMVRQFQDERLLVIRTYRTFVQTIRIGTTKTVTLHPSFRQLGDELRRMTQEILRNRYYLEGDWRGEMPMRRDLD